MQHETLRAAMWMAHNKNDQHKVPDDLVPGYRAEAVAEELKTLGWIDEDVRKTLQGANTVRLKQAKVEELSSKQAVVNYRRREAQMRVLDWVIDHEDEGGIRDLLSGNADDFTGMFTQDEIDRAGNRLIEDGFITAIEAGGGGGIIRAEPTSKGERCHEEGTSPSDFDRSRAGAGGTMYQNNFSAPVGGVQQGGSGNQMSIQQFSYSGSQDDLREILGQIRDLCETHAPEQTQSVDVLESHVEGRTASPGLVQALIAGMATALGGEAGDQLLELGGSLISVLS